MFVLASSGTVQNVDDIPLMALPSTGKNQTIGGHLREDGQLNDKIILGMH